MVMKKQFVGLFFLAVLFSLYSCEEIPPVLNPGGGGGNTGGGDLASQQRQVLVEEFTGVRCVNCPAGAQAINTLKDIYGKKLVPVSIHAGFFAQPYPGSIENYANAEGNAIQSYVGEPLGYPTAVVNRRQFAGEASLQVGQGTWAGYIADEIAAAPRIKLASSHTYDSGSRQVSGTLLMYPQENITETDVRSTIFIVQDSIADYQLTPAGVNPTYMHRHVFRGAIGAVTGVALTGPLNQGAELSRSFAYTLPANWVAEDCYLVMFVHLNGDRKDVLQVIEKKIIE